MRALASLICGFIFGWGLFISGMILPDKVLGFLDIFAIPSGNWDPSLAVVMAAALAVTAAGYALARRRTPVFEAQNQWPTQTAIDGPLVEQHAPPSRHHPADRAEQRRLASPVGPESDAHAALCHFDRDLVPFPRRGRR